MYEISRPTLTSCWRKSEVAIFSFSHFLQHWNHAGKLIFTLLYHSKQLGLCFSLSTGDVCIKHFDLPSTKEGQNKAMDGPRDQEQVVMHGEWSSSSRNEKEWAAKQIMNICDEQTGIYAWQEWQHDMKSTAIQCLIIIKNWCWDCRPMNLQMF